MYFTLAIYQMYYKSFCSINMTLEKILLVSEAKTQNKELKEMASR